MPEKLPEGSGKYGSSDHPEKNILTTDLKLNEELRKAAEPKYSGPQSPEPKSRPPTFQDVNLTVVQLPEGNLVLGYWYPRFQVIGKY